MIQKHFLRYGILMRQVAFDKLSTVNSTKLFNGILSKYLTKAAGAKGMSLAVGKPKVDSTTPSISMEILNRSEPWGAINHTKDITVEYNIYVSIKADVAQKPQSDWRVNPTEDLIIELCEAVVEILNEPRTLSYLIQTDIDGTALPEPFKVYDSHAERIQYSWLYNGALRIGLIPWFGKTLVLGPTGSGVTDVENYIQSGNGP